MIQVRCGMLELPPVCFAVPETGSIFQDWTPHIPFLSFVIYHLEPKTFVEVGVLDGNSYFSACSTIRLLRTPCACYGIDPWEGVFERGLKSGAYSGEFFESMQKRNEKYLFSRLIRKRSLDAIMDFENGSIDLLHIDASHALEDVRADFEAWLPKVSNRGVILMHDALNQDSGVPNFLQEIARFPIYTNRFEYGLACVFPGTDYPEQLSQLHTSSKDEIEYMDTVFECLGILVKLSQKAALQAGYFA